MRVSDPFAALAATLLLGSCAELADNIREPAKQAPHEELGVPTYRPMLLLPMPELKVDEGKGKALQSIVGRDTPVREVLLTLFKDSDINLLVDADVSGSLTFDIKNTSVEEAFEALLRSLDLAFEWDGSFLRVHENVNRSFDIDLLAQAQDAAQSGGGSSGGGSGNQGSMDLWQSFDQDLRTLVGEGGQILLNRAAGTVEIDARPSVVARVHEYLQHTIERATNQVSIEARILEVRLSDEFRMGVNWSLLPGFVNSDETGTLDGGAFVSQTAASGASAFNFGLLRAGDFSVFVDALEGQGQVRVLSSPRVSTLNNSPATIRVVDQIPVIGREVIDSQGGLRTQFDISFVDAGVSVTVTPQVGVDGMITARVSPQITEQTGTVVTPDGLQEQPILSTRETTTSVRVMDGQPIVIGGLRTTRKSENLTGIPLLSSIPLLGGLFRSNVQTREEVELLVLLVPRVLSSSWIDDDVRRGAHRLVTLRRPFKASTIDLDGFRREDWHGHTLDGVPLHQSKSEVRTTGEGGGPIAAGANSLTITRSGLAARLIARARTHLADGSTSQALLDLEQATQLDPGRGDCLITAALLYARRGDLARARALLTRAQRHAEPHPLAAAARGTLELMAGAPRLAQRHLVTAHDTLQADWTATNLAAALLDAGDAAAARDLLAAQAGDESPPELFANLSFANLETGDLDGAHRDLQRALAAGGDPRNPHLNALGVLIDKAVRERELLRAAEAAANR